MELSTGTVRTHGSLKPESLGGTADLDDGQLEIPYVTNNQKLEMVNADGSGSSALLVSKDNDGVKPKKDVRLGVGDLDGDGNESVFFADSDDNGQLYKYEANERLTEITDVTGKIAGVSGVADVDNDNKNELIYSNDNQK